MERADSIVQKSRNVVLLCICRGVLEYCRAVRMSDTKQYGMNLK